MTNIHLEQSETNTEKQNQKIMQESMNQNLLQTEVNILSNNISQIQRQEMTELYKKNIDIKSFLHEFQFKHKFLQNFTKQDLIIENKNSYILDITQSYIQRKYSLYNGFMFDLYTPNLFKDYNQIILQGAIKPQTENFKLKNFNINFKYFIPRGNIVHPNLTYLFIKNRYCIRDFQIIPKDRRLGFEIVKNQFKNEFYFKYPIFNSISFGDGSLVYQLKHQYNQNLRSYFKIKVAQNFIPQMKLISNYQTKEQKLDIYSSQFNLQNQTTFGLANYKNLFDQKRMISFEDRISLSDVAIQNLFTIYQKKRNYLANLKIGLFNLIGLYRNIEQDNLQKQWNIGLNLQMIIQKSLILDMFWNWNTTVNQRSLIFLMRFENDTD